ncbi:MAG TPA: hypothetical protein PLK74_05510 [Anaerolineaceae bacterium]|nr:hypothetical protein [Anaerolineaceae bacterium]
MRNPAGKPQRAHRLTQRLPPAFDAPGFTIAEHAKGRFYLSNPFNKELERRLTIDGAGAFFPASLGFTVNQQEAQQTARPAQQSVRRKQQSVARLTIVETII